MSEATDLRAVRQYFALSQSLLAQWLGVSRVRLAQAEARSPRPLPLRAAVRLTSLTLAAAGASPTPPQPLPALPGPLQARERECRYQAQRLGQLLQGMQARAVALTRRLAALPAVRAALPPGPADELRRRWLTRLLDEATDELAATCGPQSQVLLAARIAAYQHEADLLARQY